jgi:hypothetical protein
VLNPALEDHAVMDWRYRDVGGANINDKSRSFASSESETAS